MTEKRFFLMRKFLRKDKFHDIICHRFMDSKETEKALNRLYAKYSSLKIKNEQLKSTNMEMKYYIERLEEEKIKLEIKLQKIRDYAKEDGEVKHGIIEKGILE